MAKKKSARRSAQRKRAAAVVVAPESPPLSAALRRKKTRRGSRVERERKVPKSIRLHADLVRALADAARKRGETEIDVLERALAAHLGVELEDPHA